MAVGSGAAAQLPWYLRTHGARHIKSYMKMIEMKPPLFLAPNLKEVHLHKFTREHGTTEERCRSNDVMLCVVICGFREIQPAPLSPFAALSSKNTCLHSGGPIPMHSYICMSTVFQKLRQPTFRTSFVRPLPHASFSAGA